MNKEMKKGFHRVKPKGSPAIRGTVVVMFAQLDTRIILRPDIRQFIALPDSALVVQSRDREILGPGNDSIRGFNKLKSEPLGGMPSDVAVHKPGTRVVELECKSKMTTGRKRGDVTTGRVYEVQRRSCVVEEAIALSYYPKVVAMKMDRMSSTRLRQLK